jgi:hypothetical protein
MERIMSVLLIAGLEPVLVQGVEEVEGPILSS